ncbi:MAG: hypothetical protein KDB19_08125 [Microthrixaceae bacterium]|nr:hypothetical protein [Microthrixaceae bacterium]MCB9374596.1 ABC transporter permease [Microthrixaceae bacterium]MCO5306296.1 hypothetical protein [Microthrixaceae bacterium]
MSTPATLHRTGALVRSSLRTDRLRLGLWLSGVVGVLLASAASVRSLYSTASEVRRYVAMVDMSPAMATVNRAMNGPGIGFDRPDTGVVLVNEVGVWGAVVFALMAVFVTARLTRGEEESGRVDLVRSRSVGRHAPLAAAVAVAVGIETLAAAIVCVAFVMMGFGPRGSVALALGFLTVGVVSMTITALGAQVASTGRATIGIGATAIGAMFVLRAIGDAGTGALSWSSPIGWVHRMRPFAGERWWVLLLPLLTSVALGATTVALSDRRDLGSGLLHERRGADRASGPATRPTGLSVRLQRGQIVAWSIGVFVLGATYGSVASDIAEIMAENPELERFIALQGASPADSYLAYTLVLGALLVGGAAIASMLRLRHDEAEGRLEVALARPVPRWRWLGAQIWVATALSVTTLAASGAGTGVGLAVTSGDGGAVLRLIAASLTLLPVPIVLIGLTTLLVGAAPRWSALTWAALTVMVVVALLGEILRLPGWVQAISPLDHLPPVPAESFDPLVFATVAALGVLLAAVGALGFHRRDIPVAT